MSLSYLFQELFIQDGVLLKLASDSHVTDINASGSLSIVEYLDHKISMEWRPNDLIMIEADAQDADWAVVDSIGKPQLILFNILSAHLL